MANIENDKYRFFLVNGLSERQINPTGTININWTIQDESFFYEKLVGSFSLNQKNGDYQWVKNIEESSSLCDELFVRVERKCNKSWELYALSIWSINSCAFNDAKCLVTINPKAFGLGSCLKSLSGIDYNILQLMDDATGFKYDTLAYMDDFASNDLFGYDNGNMFYYGGSLFAPLLIRPQFLDSGGLPALSGTPTLKPTADELFSAGLIPEDEVPLIAIHTVGIFQDTLLSPPYIVYVAWAYRRGEAKISGICPETPNGYTLIDDSGAVCIYQKKPTDEDRSIIGVSSLGTTWGDCDDVGAFPSASDDVYNGELIGETGIPVNGLCLYVFHKDSRQTSTLTLNALLTRFIEQCNPDKIPVSDFFQINPENPSLNNYVTGLPTLTADIRFIQRSDLIFFYLQSSTVGNMSFGQLDTFLRNSFQVYWSEDFNGNLRLEHVSYYENVSVGIDATSGEKGVYTKYKKEYAYKRELFPFQENILDDGNHHNYNWDDRHIRYEDTNGKKLPCVGDGTLERAYGEFNTDFEFFIEYPTDIPRSGWVVVAVQEVLGEDEIIVEDNLLNGTMSIKRLVERYYKHSRSALTGRINGADVTFLSTIRLKQESGLAFPLCCGESFDPSDNIKTNIGVGRTTSADHNLKTDLLTTNNEY